jgi:hypothetical protein
MPATKRSPERREKDLVRIAELHLSGRPSPAEIAAELGLSETQVTRDLTELRQRWRNAGERLAGEEIARLDRLETEAWSDWKTHERLSALYLALACIDRRMKLLGLAKQKEPEIRQTIVLRWSDGGINGYREVGAGQPSEGGREGEGA